MNRKWWVSAALVAGFVAFWLFVPLRAKFLFYKEGKPRTLGRIANRSQVWWAKLGMPPSWGVSFEVPGRVSGKTRSIPLAVADYEGERYLVAMMGNRADWVLNVRANGGHAVIQHGRRREIELEDVPVEARAPILAAYLKRAPGARPHFPIGPDAAIEEFEALASEYPVLRVASSRPA